MTRYNKRIDPVGDNGLTRSQQAVARRWSEILEHLPRLAQALEKGDFETLADKGERLAHLVDYLWRMRGPPTVHQSRTTARCSPQSIPTRSTQRWAGHCTRTTAHATDPETQRRTPAIKLPGSSAVRFAGRTLTVPVRPSACGVQRGGLR
ncbi:hypothetical protein [Actinacidiphila oryziradicis]|uniref:Uncharacterized protein n=1 Tax=Actinacidiphila oryziradicis TaxID=2571141 RepID=A0A4U0RHT1_9ACTN|nr:hypothetical protein [Actinacidiphila oryziradicis]TJZ94747.1 hypothetical protein FCI23_53065 [Actinacidiphila oryziradicis]